MTDLLQGSRRVAHPTKARRAVVRPPWAAWSCALLCLWSIAICSGQIKAAVEEEPPWEPREIPPLAWDSKMKEQTTKEGQEKAVFTFNLTNIAPSELIISNVVTSCGCTIAKIPSQPWRLAPGTNGQIEVAFDTKGKHGTAQKLITVVTSLGSELLFVKVIMPPRPLTARGSSSTNRANLVKSMQRFPDRVANMDVAKADRQAVFKNQCANCHVEPTVAKTGKELYTAACGICHDALHRAGMVPDLASVTNVLNRDYWLNWVAHGKPGTLMPAFAQSEGGPLTKEQVDSLVNYLVSNPPQKKEAAAIGSHQR